MNKLGEGHLFDQINTLPGEYKVWEGGSAKRGIVMILLMSVVNILVMIGFFWFFYNFDTIMLTPNPAYETTVAEPPAKEAPEFLLNKSRALLLTILGVLTLVISGVVAAWLRVRNFWIVVTNERVCIQSGVLGRQIATIDLDKVVSVVITHGILDRLFATHSLEVVHAGSHLPGPNKSQWINPYCMKYVSNEHTLSSELLNSWLPRDNVTREVAS